MKICSVELKYGSAEDIFCSVTQQAKLKELQRRSLHPILFLLGESFSLLPNFQKAGAWQFFLEGGCCFYIKKLKSEIFNDKKVYKQKCFFSVITKKLNWEILGKNLITFKRWDGVKDEKF